MLKETQSQEEFEEELRRPRVRLKKRLEDLYFFHDRPIKIIGVLLLVVLILFTAYRGSVFYQEKKETEKRTVKNEMNGKFEAIIASQQKSLQEAENTIQIKEKALAEAMETISQQKMALAKQKYAVVKIKQVGTLLNWPRNPIGNYFPLGEIDGIKVVGNKSNPKYPANAVSVKMEFHGGVWDSRIVVRNATVTNIQMFFSPGFVREIKKCLAEMDSKNVNRFGQEGDSCGEKTWVARFFG